MVVSNLQGGLANQMFQIATGYALALDNNDTFAINYSTPGPRWPGSHPENKYKDNFYRLISETIERPSFNYNEIEELQYHKIEYNPDGMVLNGYFQNPRYFQHHKDDFYFHKNSPFIFPPEIRIAVDKVLDENIPARKYAVGIHIRGGDYKSLRHVFPECGKEYFRKALSYFDKDKCVFFVVTDDSRYAIEILSNIGPYEFKFFNSNIKLAELADLYLLTCCDYMIMSNSSFSWWGAWLNEGGPTEDKEIVIAPKNWFSMQTNKNWNELYMKGWTVI